MGVRVPHPPPVNIVFFKWRGDRAGLRCTPAKRVWVKSSPWVQIPPSPPEFVGQSPSGKAAGFGPAIRGFESSLPSQFFMGCRLMVGQRTLDPYVRVQLLPSQPFSLQS